MIGPLILSLFSGPAVAQECEPVPSALSDLDAVVSSFFSETLGAEEYCPDDLNEPVNMDDADARASQLDADQRSEAAALLLAAASALGPEYTQGIANAAGLLDALLGAALAAGEDITPFLEALLALAEGAEDPLLHRQIALNLWRRGVDDPRVDALVETYLPDSPNYERIFPDGKTEITAVFRTGRDGFAHSEIKRAFEMAGATVTVVEEDTHYSIEHVVVPDDPALPTITWTIEVVRHGWAPADAFEDMANDEVEVSMFADHSQLGTSLDRGLENRPESDSSQDFFWVDACKSKVFTSRLSRAYPEGHFIYTIDSEYFRDMPVSFERGLVALANHYDYDEMERFVGAGTSWQPKNYLFPNNPQKLVYQDQDGDGIIDSEDRIYNVTDDPEEPSGELATRAVHIANTYMAYSSFYQYHHSRRSVEVEDLYRPDGIFDGEPGEPLTRIEEREDAFGENKFFVAVSDEALAMGQSERTARIAADMGSHQAELNGYDEQFSQVSGFMLGAAVYEVWMGDGWDSYRDATMPGLDLDRYEATDYLDGHDFVTSDGLGRFISEQLLGNE